MDSSSVRGLKQLTGNYSISLITLSIRWIRASHAVSVKVSALSYFWGEA